MRRAKGIDMRPIAIAAVDAAFDQYEKSATKKRRSRLLTAPRALVAGAALMTAGRLAVGGRGRGLLESLEQRVSLFEDQDEERNGDAPGDVDLADDEFDEPEAEEDPEAYDEEEGGEPYDDEEGDPESYREEDEEEPEDYEDEDYEDDEQEEEEPEDDVDERRERPKAGARSKRRS
jgi:hypothetical protein